MKNYTEYDFKEILRLTRKLLELNDFTGVIKISKHILNLNSSQQEFNYLLGVAYGATGEHELARKAFLSFLAFKYDEIVFVNYITTLLPCEEVVLFLSLVEEFYEDLSNTSQMLLLRTIVEGIRTEYIHKEELPENVQESLNNVSILLN